MSKIEIKDLSFKELSERLSEAQEPSFRAAQIFDWIYNKGARSFGDMTNISKESRAKLENVFSIQGLEAREFLSNDGTVKFLFHLPDGLAIESVLIPMQGRLTLCISSQVGCPLNCKFCLTGRIGFKRNLETWEIVSQVSYVSRKVREKRKKISNIVLMGMGEPLLNFDNTMKALDIFQSKEGFAFNPRKITLSTAGISPMIEKFGKLSQVKLAVSLNAPNEQIRSMLMPINQKHSLNGLIKVLWRYPLKNRENITFEYIMIDGINDSSVHAEELVRLLKGIKAKVNLIPLNAGPKVGFKSSPIERMENFRSYLEKKKLPAMIRKSKGRSINAACGQLVGSQ